MTETQLQTKLCSVLCIEDRILRYNLNFRIILKFNRVKCIIESYNDEKTQVFSSIKICVFNILRLKNGVLEYKFPALESDGPQNVLINLNVY